MVGALTTGLLVGLSIAVFVGFAAMSVIETAAYGGLRTGLVAGVGIATGDGLWAAITAAGGTALNHLLGAWESYLRWAALGVLVVLGVRAVRQALRPESERTERIPESAWGIYRTYLTATLRDPVTVIFFGSLVLGTAPRYGPAQSWIFAAGAFLGSLSWQSALAGFGARRDSAFSTRTRRRLWLLDCTLLALFTVYIALGWYR